MLDRLDAGEPAASPAEADARRPYERLLADLAAVEDVEPPAGWQGRLDERRRREMAAPRRRWALGAGAGVLATAALAAVWLLTCRGEHGAPGAPAEPRLAMEMRAGDGVVRRGGDSVVGDVVEARAVLDRAHGELRIYRDTALIARCPGDPPCRRDGTRVEVSLRSEVPGEYRAVALRADQAIPPPGPGGLDDDLLAARQAGVTIERRPAVTVGR